MATPKGLPTQRDQFIRRSSRRLAIQVGNHHLRARVSERVGDLPADAAGRAGDDRHLVLEIHVPFLL